MLLIFRAKKQGRYSGFGVSINRLEHFRFFIQLGKIASLELGPFLGVVRKPLAQLFAGRNVFQPQIDLGFVLAQAARLQPVNQNSRAVIGSRLGINPFRFDQRVHE